METSRVLVTYSDPSGIYPSISDDLKNRFPLRQLNWNSSSRPLRSIPALNVELVSEDDFSRASEHNNGEDSTSPRESAEVAASRGRRHQIPGLRQSPYLKIYLLKCDDVESYRNVARKDLREWVAANSAPSQSSATLNKPDNHDAYEWLIVHVIHDTSGTATSAGRHDGDTGKRNTSRWSSRSSTISVTDKIRADFNGTSKTAIDRVVQITSWGSKEEPEGNAESKQSSLPGWDDLLARMKASILASLDLRVGQYEEDIREKEMQRKMPGWNFNTFFVLKEGLARGFESVGLLEDALTGYQELSAELNGLIVDQEENNTTASPFNDFTVDLQEELIRALSSGDKSQEQNVRLADFGASVLDTRRKDFRYLILSNNISVFDFQSYVYARQMRLLLRLANSNYDEREASSYFGKADAAENSDLVKPNDFEPENLTVLAEACQLSSAFLATAAVTMREDFERLVDAKESNIDGEDVLTAATIENLVLSWTISVVQVIIAATTSRTLSAQLTPVMNQLGARSQVVDVPPSSVSRKDQSLPERRSSLAVSPTKKQSISHKSSFLPLDAVRMLPPGPPHPGARELASERGNLILLSRRALDRSALENCGWSAGLKAVAAVANNISGQMNEVNLEDDSSPESAPEHDSLPLPRSRSKRGVRNQALNTALQTEDQYLEAFNISTIDALACYVVASRKNMAEAIMADIATTRYFQKDYASAAAYFDQLAHFYNRSEWSMLERTMLDMHAHCLKTLGRTENFIRTALKAISLDDNFMSMSIETPCNFAELSKASETLSEPVLIPLLDHFTSISLVPFIQHYDSSDGFEMTLKLRNLLPEGMRADSITITAKCISQPQSSALELTTSQPKMLEEGTCRVRLRSKVMHYAWYSLQDVSILVNNINFSSELPPTRRSSMSFGNRTRQGILQGTDFLVWPRTENTTARISHSNVVDLRKPKSLQVEISSGWNEIEYGRLIVKPGSAGLRLENSEAKAVGKARPGPSLHGPSHEYEDSSFKVNMRREQPSTIRFEKLERNQTQAVRIPYSLEHDLNEVTLKIELTYQTESGEFIFLSNTSCSVALALSVNVQEIFKPKALFSRFTVGPINSTPLRLHSCLVEGNNYFDALTPTVQNTPTDVFARQPYSLISKIQRKHPTKAVSAGLSKSFQRLLHLQIRYNCLDQEILDAIDQSLTSLLKTNTTKQYHFLMRDRLNETFRLGKGPWADMETSCLVGDFPKGSFEDYEWTKILPGLLPNEASELEAILRAWYEAAPTIPFSKLHVENLRPQYLTVPFDLPSTQALFTAGLQSLNGRPVTTTDEATVAVDQPLPMHLTITRVKQWDEEHTLQGQAEVREFYYELSANPDVWLVGGQRRARFDLKAGESSTFDVLLLPRTTGRLLYPSLEINPVPDESQQQSDGRDGSAEGPSSSSNSAPTFMTATEPTYEVDFLNHGETVMVVPNYASTTVSLDPASGGGWLVESKSRE